MPSDKYFLITIDVEDWFQVENFKPWIPFNTWPSYELRVEKNTHRLLDLLDSFESAGKPEGRSRKAKSTQQWGPMNSRATDNELRTTSHGHSEAVSIQPPSLPASRPSGPSRPKATFFVLGWIAERLPHLVQEIHSRGHEIASHGHNHNLCTECSAEDLKTDLINSKKLLEDIIGDRVYGYRAPSFAINNDILKIIKDCGYQYDSSYNSFNLHGRYGKISLNGIEKKGIAFKLSETFFELPVSNISFKNNGARRLEKVQFCECLTIPWSGGAYFRLIPSLLFKAGIKIILKKENAYLFYMHPWEIDPEQPIVNGASASFKFRHYINLNKTYSKLKKFINHFKRCRFVTCTQYLEEISERKVRKNS